MCSPDDPFSGSADNEAKSKIPLVVIIGPTAVGKTEVSVELAESFDGEIVSADSRLFYRGMDIGTAKPTIDDRRRVPHHLIDVADPDQTWSLALFQAEANRAIQEIFHRDHLPFLVGGTGQFVRSVIEGWKIPPAHPNPNLRIALQKWAGLIGANELHRKLAVLDPPAANSIDPTNLRRTIRAWEVILSTGRRFSEQKTRGPLLYQALLIGLMRPRVELYRRIDDRIQNMLGAGLIDEVKGLLDAGYSPELPTMSAIGYGESVAYLQGKISLEEAITLMKRRTREFVRRQSNWFKENDPAIQWFQVDESTVTKVDEVIMEWLNSLNGYEFHSAR